MEVSMIKTLQVTGIVLSIVGIIGIFIVIAGPYFDFLSMDLAQKLLWPAVAFAGIGFALFIPPNMESNKEN